MIVLRELKEKDAVLMLEWMHDPDVQKGFRKNMMDATLEDAREFCKNSKIPNVISCGDNLHFAIVNGEDEYLGTVSLKNIDTESLTAEYAITTRKKVAGMGVGYAATGMILNKALNEYGLRKVYLSVLENNKAAINLYEKSGFKFEGEFRKHIKKGTRYMNWKWYGMLKNEYDEHRLGGELIYLAIFLEREVA